MAIKQISGIHEYAVVQSRGPHAQPIIKKAPLGAFFIKTQSLCYLITKRRINFYLLRSAPFNAKLLQQKLKDFIITRKRIQSMKKFTNEDLWFELDEDSNEYFSAHVTMIINEHGEDWCREHKCDLGYITYIVRDGMFEFLGHGSNFHPAYADQESAIISAIDPHISGFDPDILSQGHGTPVELDHSQWVKMYT